jgi:phage shock protein PspC (stress-responsive transcriptional regulator)
MDFKKFGLGNGGFFGVCDGLSNFTGIPVLAFRILALVLMYKGLFIFYWYAWILLFVSNISSGKKRETIININLSNEKIRKDDSSESNSNSNTDTNHDSEVWESFNQKFNTAWKKTKDKKKIKKNKKSSENKISFDDFKTKHFNK